MLERSRRAAELLRTRLLGLLGYVLAPLAEPTGVDMAWLLAALAPVVLLAVWLGLRQVKRRLRH